MFVSRRADEPAVGSGTHASAQENQMKDCHVRRTDQFLDQVPYRALAREALEEYPLLLQVLASASFIEATSDLYTDNLVDFLRADREALEWLTGSWRHEELRHGVALKRYVEAAWPDFDWDGTYRAFSAEYRSTYREYQLAASPAREMVARCVVETGTTTFYRMLAASVAEPVLKQIASAIANDEVRHYKHFYRYFLRFQAAEGLSRGTVLHTIGSRVADIHADDSFIAFKHVWRACNPGITFRIEHYRDFRRELRRLARNHYPYDLAIKMLSRPLNLTGVVKRVAIPAATLAARQFLAA